MLATPDARRRIPPRLRILAASILWALSPARSAVHHFAVDVPTTLEAETYLPNHIVRFEDGRYSVAARLPEGTEILALDRTSDGLWLLAPSHPATLGAAEYTPRDIVAFDGTSYRCWFDGAAAGIPPYARIDALFVDGFGKPILSFDVPVEIGGQEYGRSDLVAYDGGFRLRWNARTAGVPPYANLVGAAESPSGEILVSFDVPVVTQSGEILPGSLVRWGATEPVAVLVEPAWPRGSQIRDFSFEVSPAVAGAVPDGAAVPGVPLTMAKGPSGLITLRWGAACGAATTDYAIYEGTLSSWSSHAARACSTGGALEASLAAAPGSAYFLVVPRSAAREGSYGQRSPGVERPQATAACLPRESGSCR